MKLSALNIGRAIAEGVDVEILSPCDRPDLGLVEGAPTGMVVRVRSSDSKAFAEAIERIYGTRLKRKAGPQQPLSQDEVERKAVDVLIALTVSWRGFENEDGSPIECNEANMRAVYGDPGYKWLREQLDQASSDRRRFFGG